MGYEIQGQGQQALLASSEFALSLATCDGDAFAKTQRLPSTRAAIRLAARTLLVFELHRTGQALGEEFHECTHAWQLAATARIDEVHRALRHAPCRQDDLELLFVTVKTNIGACRKRPTVNLLHLDSSGLGAHSVSRELSGAVVKEWKRAHPGAKVTYREVSAQPLSHWTPAADAGDPAARLGGDVLDEFLAADVAVIGAPMNNFGSRAR